MACLDFLRDNGRTLALNPFRMAFTQREEILYLSVTLGLGEPPGLYSPTAAIGENCEGN